MFGFLNTSSVPSSTAEILSKGKIAVVFNLPDHESILVASMTSLLLKEKAEVMLVDIRDPLPDAESYLWIGCGNATSLSGYYADQIDRKSLNSIFASSVFVTRPVKLRIEYEDGLFYQTLEVLNDAGIDGSKIMKRGVISQKWYSDDLPGELVVPYYKALEMATALYTGEDIPLSDFLDAPVECSTKEVKEFEKRQIITNRSLGKKVRQTNIGDKAFHMVTGLSEDIYGIIRRLAIGKNSILHLSMGSYGMVLYSDKPVDAERMKLVNALNLSPINK